MKKEFLKWIYASNKEFFYNEFVEEFLGDIPKGVSEPSMQFLANGKDKLEKWCLWMAHVLQRRIQTDKKEIDRNEGMLLMLKLFLTLVVQARKPKATTVGKAEEGEKPETPEQIIDDWVKGIKEKKTAKDKEKDNPAG